MSVALEDLLKLTPDEILAHNEKPTSEQLRNKQQTYFEDVHEGMELPKYIYSPTPTHLFRWSAAIENFHRIHYDLDFGLNHDKNPQHFGTRLVETERGAPVPQGLDPARRLALEGEHPTPGNAGARRHHNSVGQGDQQRGKGRHGPGGTGPGNDHPGRH